MHEEENKSRDLFIGISLLLIGALMLGASGIFVKISESSPSLIAFYRAFFALPFLYVWMIYEDKKNKKDIVWNKRNKLFLVVGGLCFALDMVIWNWSLVFTSVANATLMANTAPVFVVLFGVLFLSYKIKLSFIISLLFAFVGVCLVVLPGERVMVLGDSLGLMAAIFYAGYILSIKELTNVLKPGKTLFFVTLSTVFFLLPISLIESNGLSINESEILLLLLYAIFSQTIAQGLITYGISLVSAHLSSLILLMQPVAAAFYGWLLLEEIISPMQAIGGMIVLLAIYAASRKD